ncbi:MAG: transglutaminase-like domain-containing protein [candidate division WOR-3 bacterium]|nr:transglutaminase-like domain-containing protein [candidate division WOR-3 bacterium]MCX7948354.1 transglutaminase-like domain-containing protein [candidate division WOR-3 bacterium]MDW8151255.1 transglutaminase-like domain-containing protein [candidate division WOR-3 bacterium]
MFKKIIFLSLVSCSFVENKFIENKYEDWFSAYIRGNKVGYYHYYIRKVFNSYEVVENSILRLKMLDQDKELQTLTKIKLDNQLKVKSFSFELKTDVFVKVNGEVKNNKLIVKMEGKNMPKTERIHDLKYEFYLPQAWWALLILGKEPPKEMNVYDPTNFVLGTAKSENLGLLETQYNGKTINARVYRTNMFGAETKVYIYQNRIIKVEMPFDITLISEPKEIATKTENKNLDVLLTFAIQPNGTFDPNKDSVLLLKLENLRGELVLDFGAQKIIEKDSNGVIIEIKRQNIKDIKEDSNIPDSIRQYLKADAFAQSDDPRIKKLAQEIVSNKTSILEKSRAIMHWVYTNLEKRPTVSVPNAIEVLNMGYGDCNEHSILYTALARAAGIPTDIIVGLIYQNGRYYYHAWNAIYISGNWIWIDPTFNQFPADVGHIMLQRGSIDKQAEIMGIVGKLQIQVLSTK